MVPFRTATSDDHDAVSTTVTAAFATDPLWGPLLYGSDGDDSVARRWWDLYVDGALRYPSLGFAGDGDAITVWIPPGGTELDADGEAAVHRLVQESLPERADDLADVERLFEEAHPTDPHWYLSLFATRPESRGQGIGMALLRHDLERIDALGMPAYLESSNPANDARYAREGFEKVGEFTVPGTGAVVSTMWRAARVRPSA
jgi:GNAT superfamily N-acetyltransferase